MIRVNRAMLDAVLEKRVPETGWVLTVKDRNGKVMSRNEDLKCEYRNGTYHYGAANGGSITINLIISGFMNTFELTNENLRLTGTIGGPCSNADLKFVGDNYVNTSNTLITVTALNIEDPGWLLIDEPPQTHTTRILAV